MARNIVLYGHPMLRKKTLSVSQFDDALKALCQEMIEIMQEHEGVGIAAPQINVNLRIFIADLCADQDPEEPIQYDKAPLIAINPRVTFISPYPSSIYQEGCLSIPGLYADVKRYPEILLEACDVYGEPFQISASGMLARIIQHENDHLNGVLFVDKVLAKDRKMVEQFLKDFRKTHA